MNHQRGFVMTGWMYLAAVIVILTLIAGLIAWADRNIATTAGVNKGKAEVQALWDGAVEDQRAREMKASLEAAKELQDARRARKPIIEERIVYVNQIVDRPIYRNLCLDDDGVRCANSALVGGKAAAGCKPDGRVSGNKPAG